MKFVIFARSPVVKSFMSKINEPNGGFCSVESAKKKLIKAMGNTNYIYLNGEWDTGWQIYSIRKKS
jgi:hypothetical protein